MMCPLHNVKRGKSYYMAILRTHMLFNPKTLIYCFSLIELIKTKILSSHMLNLVQNLKITGDHVFHKTGYTQISFLWIYLFLFLDEILYMMA